MIPRDLYDIFQSHFYDERHVKLYTEPFQFFVKQRLDELEHPSLITEWNHNMDTASYMKQSEK